VSKAEEGSGGEASFDNVAEMLLKAAMPFDSVLSNLVVLLL
jgi:hypothetical protein